MVLLVIIPAAAAGSWSGYVVDDSTGSGLPGANVSAYDSSTDDYINSNLTDVSGAFRVDGLTNSVYLVASSAGYTPDSTQTLPPTGANNYTLPFNISLFAVNPPGSIAGTVSNSTDPLANAVVRALQGGNEVANTTTNAAGAYTLANLNHGTYTVEASKGGITENITNVLVEPGQNTGDVDFTLESTTCVEDWNCTAWSACSGGVQTRTCTDLNACGTTLNKPAESQSCSTGGSSCFPAGTKILMEDGNEKNIEDVKVGDKILGFSGDEQVVVEVLELESPVRDHIYTLAFEDGSTLELTREHPLYSEDGWKSLSPEETALENDELEVKELRLGDKVLNSKGNYVKITGIDYAEKQVQTYNLKRVSDCNNFFANSYLAHNKGSPSHKAVHYEADISPGKSVKQTLMRSDYVTFDYEDEEHRITLLSLTKSSAVIRVESNPVTATLSLLQKVGFNFDDDLMNDLFITFKSSTGSQGEFEFELAEPAEIPSLPVITPPAAPQEPVDVPQQSGNPITIIVEDEDVIIEDEDGSNKVTSAFMHVKDFFKETLEKILYLKYIVAGIVILAVLILIISLATKIKAVKKAAKRSRKKEELLRKVKELEAQLKDLKKAV